MPTIFPRLKEIISRGDNLPTLPKIVFQLHRVLDDPRAGANEVARVIEQDPALTARLLRTVNSAAYVRSGTHITSVPTAVTHLGLNQVRAVCIVLAVVRAFGKRRARLNPEDFWSHSATVAELASILWRRVGRASHITPDDAYVVGLLHDVGLLVIDQHFPTEFSQVLEAREHADDPISRVEEAHLGIDHGAVASLLLGRWSLPSFVADAVSNHNHPWCAPPETAQLAMVLAAAEAMCWEMDLGLPIEGRPVEPAAVLLRRLGVPAPEVRGLIQGTCDVYAEAAGLLAA